MAARVLMVNYPDGFIWEPGDVQRLWFFPNGSQYHRGPHFHTITSGGFRQNFPLNRGFVAVLSGKLSVKDYWGKTTHRLEVIDHTWYFRDTGYQRRASWVYAQMIPRHIRFPILRKIA